MTLLLKPANPMAVLITSSSFCAIGEYMTIKLRVLLFVVRLELFF